MSKEVNLHEDAAVISKNPEQAHQELVEKAIREAQGLGSTILKAVRNPELQKRLHGLAMEIEFDLQKEQ